MKLIWILAGILLASSLTVLLICEIRKRMERRRAPPPLPPQRRAAPRQAPPLPRNAPPADGRIYSYPKCPIDRMRNRPGAPQEIFFVPERNCYRCSDGHYFTGKEH